ncbi:hypothetical protein GGX14DRAFT_563891 [Mycena pura]|uniref:DUF6534 domain-containing protein n=1 Tax=Mycena pura TaxID=153505 RepID=A0AAD6YCJ5_9AGAR|nr:hypothetical protein GGX14DRAFT_563891 [Mycena pura]
MSTPDVPTTLGAMLIGGFFASMLSGIVSMQTLTYIRTYTSDPKALKYLVLSVWFLDTVHTALIWAAMWIYVIGNFGSASKINDIPCCIVHQVHFIDGRYNGKQHVAQSQAVVAKNWYMASSVMLLALLRLAAASVSTAMMLQYKGFDQFKLHARWVFTLGLSVSSTVDILVTAFLVYLFHLNKLESGPLNHVIDKLMVYAFETGSLTCLGAIVSMICWVTMENLVFLGLHFAIGKLYATSLLVTYVHLVSAMAQSFYRPVHRLNTRNNIRRAVSNTSGERGGALFLETRPSGKDTSLPYFADPSSPRSLRGKPLTEVQINVERSVQYDRERTSIDSVEIAK